MKTTQIPHYHTGKPSSKQFQLRFSVHHKKLVETNENQSIITKRFDPIFRRKSRHSLVRSRWDHRRHQGLPEWYHRGNIKTHLVNFRKSVGKIYYSSFRLGWTYYVIQWKIETLLQREVVLQARFLTGKSPRWIQPGHWDRVFFIYRKYVFLYREYLTMCYLV